MNQIHASDLDTHSMNDPLGFSGGESSLRILVAEDNTALRRLLALVLLRDGHEVVETRDAGELLEALASSLVEEGEAAYDLVICEHSLPGIVGLAVLAGLRARDRSTPFILITGDEDVQDRARHLGAVVLDHPFSIAAIRGAIRQSAEQALAAND
jgi:two-component system response regulator TctD